MLPDPILQNIERCKGGRRRGRALGIKVATSVVGCCWRVFHNGPPVVSREKIFFPAAARESELRSHSFQPALLASQGPMVLGPCCSGGSRRRAVLSKLT